MSSHSDLQTLPETSSSPDLPAPAPPEIIQRYINGESIQTIARQCSVSRQAIYKRIHQFTLSGQSDQAYRDIVTDALISKIADADQELDAADTAVDIARAREKARFSRMDFERRRPNLYGQKQQDTNEKVIVIVNRSHDSPNTQTLDVSPHQITDGT